MPASSNTAAPFFIVGRSGYSSLQTDYGYQVGIASMLSDGGFYATVGNKLERVLADGTPDLSYNFSGNVTLRMGKEGYIGAFIYGPTVLPSGKVLVSAVSNWSDSTGYHSDLALLRLNADGSRDTTFGAASGQVHTDPGPLVHVTIAGTSVLADGRVLVVTDNWQTDSQGGATQGNPHHTVITRYLANGALDTKWAAQGVARDDLLLHANASVLQANGQMLVAGNFEDTPGSTQFGLARFNADGSRDLSFGSDGAMRLSPGTPYGTGMANAVAVQADGKIIVVGSNTLPGDPEYRKGATVVRLNQDGTLDGTFASNGVYNHLFGDSDGNSFARFVHVNEDGSIFVAGEMATTSYVQKIAVMRLHSDGTLDTSFGVNGVASLDTGAPMGGTIYSMNVTADGHILLTADTVNEITGGSPLPILVEFDAHGQLATNFGDGAHSNTSSADYLQGHLEQFLNPTMTLTDMDMVAAGNYAGASVTLVRDSGANAADQFVAGGALSFANGIASVDGVAIGTVAGGKGSLRITFDEHATQALVNTALQSIAYQNSASLAETQQVAINWTVSDGQLSFRAVTDVTLHPTDVPYWIDGLLHDDATHSAQQLHDTLNAALGDSHGLNLQFGSDAGAAAYTSADQAFIRKMVAQLTAVTDLHLASDGAQLHIDNTAQLAAGQGASTAMQNGSGALYYAFGAAGSSANTLANSAALLHQLEQVLGLQHAQLPSMDDHLNLSVMSDGAATAVAGSVQALGVLDIAALQYLYGPSQTARLGNDTYQLSADGSNFVWDGAGTDTISAAGLNGNLTLHLDPGHWDYVGSQGSSITAPGQVTVNYGSVIENATGGNGDDHITGTGGANVLRGGAGNDVLSGGGGNDVLDGGTGHNTALYAGKAADYKVSGNANGWSVTDNAGSDGSDQLTHIDRLQFADRSVALDIDGASGQTYRLYQAAFNRAPDLAGMGYWIAQQEASVSLHDIANAFTQSAEFTKLYGANATNDAFLTRLYSNVLHRTPDSAGKAYWLDLLQHDVARVDVLLSFSESAENQAAVIGSIAQGIAFTPFH